MIRAILEFFGIRTGYSSNLIKVDDNNWIHDGKCVSFDDDTEMTRWQQEVEDRGHYDSYEYGRIPVLSKEFYKRSVKPIHRFSVQPQY